MVSSIIELSSLNINDIPSLGGKGKNLALLSSNNIPVPRWFCVTSHVYESHIGFIKDKIEPILKTIDYEDFISIKDASEKIQNLIHNQNFNKALEQDIISKLNSFGDNKFYSIRSSALNEDSKEFSFAGLFDTYLYIPQSMVKSKIVECWSSLFTDRALSYFSKNNLSPLDVEMAVIVQEMVESVKSGVLFQSNPVGRFEESVIVGGYGLGEGVVSNQVETDTYIYNQLSKSVKSIINKKHHQLKYDKSGGYGVSKVEVPVLQGEKSVLAEDELSGLISISYDISRIYDTLQDIEWAIDEKGKIYILQSRPITTIPTGEVNIYDRSNVSENYPGVTSPLTCSTVKSFYKENFLTTYRNIGFPSKYIDEFDKYFKDLIVTIQGKVYYNLTNWYRALAVLPGSSKTKFSFFEQMIGAKKNTDEEELLVHPLAKFKVRIITLWAFLNWKRKFANYKQKFNRIYKSNQKALKNIDYNDLGNFYLKVANDFWSVGDITCRNSFYVMLLTGTVKKELKLLSPNDYEDLFNALLIGEEGIESVEPLISIIKMTEMVRASKELLKVLTDGIFFSDNEKMKNKHKEFYEAFERHIDRYGDRGALELKLECKTFRQKPENLVSMILSYVDTDITIENMSNQRVLLRTDAEKKLAELLKDKFFKRIYVNYIVKKVRFFVKNRESGRLDRTRIYGLVREIFLKISEKWKQEGIISDEDDIFYLTEQEIISNMQNINRNEIREIIKRRKCEWEKYYSCEPEDRIFLRGDISKNFIPQKESKNMDTIDSSDLLKGLGCCPGITQGEVIVLKSPNENEIVKDKILVAKNTDPGWIFWIMASKGLIVENGNFLSHTAIIGRELGKPTIVNVANATKKIPPNSVVLMDGQEGTVKLLNAGM